MYSKYRNSKRQSILHKYYAEIFGALTGLLIAYAAVQYIDDSIEQQTTNEVRK